MDPLSILLIDNSEATLTALEKAPTARASAALDVRFQPSRNGNGSSHLSLSGTDVVLLGDRLTRRKVVEWAAKLRGMGYARPILLLTRQSEDRLPTAYRDAGVDDLLDIADISTPLFSWTFTSTIRKIIDRRKAAEYDYLRDRLGAIKRSVTTLIHDLNTPLSVIRLAAYHLEHSNPTKERRELYHTMLVENVERIEEKLRDLYHIRRLLTLDRKVDKPGPSR